GEDPDGSMPEPEQLGADAFHVLAAHIIVVGPQHDLTAKERTQNLFARRAGLAGDGADSDEAPRLQRVASLLAFGHDDGLARGLLHEFVDTVEREVVAPDASEAAGAIRKLPPEVLRPVAEVLADVDGYDRAVRVFDRVSGQDPAFTLRRLAGRFS